MIFIRMEWKSRIVPQVRVDRNGNPVMYLLLFYSGLPTQHHKEFRSGDSLQGLARPHNVFRILPDADGKVEIVLGQVKIL